MIAKGDTLWDIATKNLGDPTKWIALYEASQSVIEAAARTYGHATSDHGNLIFPGTRLSVPGGTCHPETRQPAPTAQQLAQIAQQNRVEHIPASCSKPLMIGVRGSDEKPEVEGNPVIPRDLGPEVGRISTYLSDTQVYGLPYPAAKVFPNLATDSAEKLAYELAKNKAISVIVGGNPVTKTAEQVKREGFPVPDSVKEGAANLEADLLAQVGHCHGQKQKVVLAGYSQGAWVIRVALAALKRDHPHQWADVLDSISGIGLLADPYNKFFQPPLPEEFGLKNSYSVCLPGDPVCNDPLTTLEGVRDCTVGEPLSCTHLLYGITDIGKVPGKTAIQDVATFLQRGLKNR
ncbi:cutinase family protein [Streptomyces sp. NPDC007905]|uniref:cutinase family protein n=1 Tax=Streptomyces sp. NPDC007905 TaxID=3364788 RepID=UPI0036E37D05